MLIDFGYAEKYIENNKKKKFYKLAGTHSYMSKEVMDEDYDESCDIFALGIILYIMIAGGHPF